MRTINIFLSFFIFFILFTSCEKEIEFSGTITNPLIVVNCIVSPDSIMTAHISKSKFFLANDDTFDNIENADISVFVNGIFKEKMVHSAYGLYKSNYIPNAGDTIEMKVISGGMHDVNCQTIVTTKPNIISVDTVIESLNYNPTIAYKTDNYGNIISSDTTGANLNYQIKFKMKISDNTTEKNYYRITPQQYAKSDYPNSNYNYINIVLDGILSDNQNNPTDVLDISGSYNIYNIFSDELFNGKDFTISFTISGNSYITLSETEIPVMYINLQNINGDYYKYLYTRDLSNKTDGFFSEPVQIYNNVKNGIGIFGAYNNDNTAKINLKELYEIAKKSGSFGYNMKHSIK